MLLRRLRLPVVLMMKITLLLSTIIACIILRTLLRISRMLVLPRMIMVKMMILLLLRVTLPGLLFSAVTSRRSRSLLQQTHIRNHTRRYIRYRLSAVKNIDIYLRKSIMIRMIITKTARLKLVFNVIHCARMRREREEIVRKIEVWLAGITLIEIRKVAVQKLIDRIELIVFQVVIFELVCVFIPGYAWHRGIIVFVRISLEVIFEQGLVFEKRIVE